MAWSVYIDQTYTLLGSPASGDNQILISGLTSDQIVILASAPQASPTWRLAARSFFIWPYPTFPAGGATLKTYAARIDLNQKALLIAPLPLSAPYQLELSVPHWIKSLNVKAWQFEQESGEALIL